MLAEILPSLRDAGGPGIVEIAGKTVRERCFGVFLYPGRDYGS